MNNALWSDHLRALARQTLAGTPLDPESPRDAAPGLVADFIAGFRDERGHRRAVDRPLLARLLGADPGPIPDRPMSADVRLWWALHTGEPIAGLFEPGPGPLLGEAEFARGAIEATTETELAALHALAHHAARDPSGVLAARCLDAARWHVAALQPDNGTNHPWAVHVFLGLAEAEADPSDAYAARLHAESLVHNALVSSGRPDLFSACLLLDAAASLA